MSEFITVVILCLMIGASWVEAAEKESPTEQAEIDAEDLKVVAEMENLQLIDVVEDMDMLKDINYLIEDDQEDDKEGDQNETETD